MQITVEQFSNRFTRLRQTSANQRFIFDLWLGIVRSLRVEEAPNFRWSHIVLETRILKGKDGSEEKKLLRCRCVSGVNQKYEFPSPLTSSI
jgi:hypothetical protein